MTRLKLKGLYMYGAGFYTYSIFALIFWETRRSDFAVSMGHHVASVILIVLSYIFRFWSEMNFCFLYYETWRINCMIWVLLFVLEPLSFPCRAYVWWSRQLTWLDFWISGPWIGSGVILTWSCLACLNPLSFAVLIWCILDSLWQKNNGEISHV